MGQRISLIADFDQEGAKETAAIVVPSWAKSIYLGIPTLDACSLTVALSLDGKTWGKRGNDLDGNQNPRSNYTGGSATFKDILWFDVAGYANLKVISSVAQAGKSIEVMFRN